MHSYLYEPQSMKFVIQVSNKNRNFEFKIKIEENIQQSNEISRSDAYVNDYNYDGIGFTHLSKI